MSATAEKTEVQPPPASVKVKKKRVPKEKRQNLRLWAEGARETILLPHIEAYADALELGWRQERDAFQRICNEFHERVDWRLADHEEPELPLPAYDPNVLVEAEMLTPEEEYRKQTRIDVLDKRIRRWLKYRVRRLRRHVGRKIDPRNDPYAVLLAKLSGVTAPPKARQAYQQYMKEEYKEKVAPVVAERWAATPAAGSSVQVKKDPNVSFSSGIAREMFLALPEEKQKEYGAKAKAEAAAAKAVFEKALKEPPAKGPEARQMAIDEVGNFLSPILQGVMDRTGMHVVVMLGGPMPKYGGEFHTVHVSVGRNKTGANAHFPQWAKERWGSVQDLMKEYLATAFSPQEQMAAALPEDLLAGAKYKISQVQDPLLDVDSDDSDEEQSDEDTDAHSSGSDSEAGGASTKRKKKKRAAKVAEKEEAKKTKAGKGAKRGKGGDDGKKKTKGKGKEKEVDSDKAEEREGEQGKKRKKTASDTSPPRKSRRIEEGAAAGAVRPVPAIQPTSHAASPSTAGAGTVTPVREQPVGTSVQVQPAGPTSAADDTANVSVPPSTPAAPPAPPTTPPKEVQGNPALSAAAAAYVSGSQPAATRMIAFAGADPVSDPLGPPALPDDAPTWLKNAVSFLTETDLGPHFRALLEALIKVEVAYGFDGDSSGPKAGVAKAGRPDVVNDWISKGRGAKSKRRPPVENLRALKEQWKSWWASLQPGWRTKDAAGRYVIGGEYGVDWDAFDYPGQNGTVSIVAGLYFWGGTRRTLADSEFSDGAQEEWEAAVADVSWMLEGLEAWILIP